MFLLKSKDLSVQWCDLCANLLDDDIVKVEWVLKKSYDTAICLFLIHSIIDAYHHYILDLIWCSVEAAPPCFQGERVNCTPKSFFFSGCYGVAASVAAGDNAPCFEITHVIGLPYGGSLTWFFVLSNLNWNIWPIWPYPSFSQAIENNQWGHRFQFEPGLYQLLPWNILALRS